MPSALLLLLLFLFSLFSFSSLEVIAKEPSLEKKIEQYLLLSDDSSALFLVEKAIQKKGESPYLYKKRVEILALTGKEKKMLNNASSLFSTYPEEAKDEALLEKIAWGVLEKGEKSDSRLIRMYALIGSFYSQDAKGVSLLLRSLRDSNIFVRGVAAELVSYFRDDCLREELKNMFYKEREKSVRLAIIRSFGELKEFSMQNALLELLQSESAFQEEKQEAIQALVKIIKNIEDTELIFLRESNRVEMRALACQVLVESDSNYLNAYEHLSFLLKDFQADVRMQAWYTCGRLSFKKEQEESLVKLAKEALKDKDYRVSILAAKFLVAHGYKKRGLEALEGWLYHRKKKKRVFAAVALSHSGEQAVEALTRGIKESKDLYVRVNLALGLMGQRRELLVVIDEIEMFLSNHSKLLMFKNFGPFLGVALSEHEPHPHIPRYREAADQLVRLDLLNRLVILESPNAQKNIIDFLKGNNWEVTGMASIILLQEGNFKGISAVEELLKKEDKKTLVQAGIILALLRKDKDARAILEKSYLDVNRELKEKILESLGQMAFRESIPFLVEQLQSPFQQLRIMSASALLCCLRN